ncbi:transcriptional regulator FilR1 domain-containing protein [Halobellus sp. GM3]|uniref:transcriptional regulator FilR1 domain-containing protein n=1 Tax=Halobellus sp. GM3 TaxID=3458410 RepID=UPI00403DAB4B
MNVDADAPVQSSDEHAREAAAFLVGSGSRVAIFQSLRSGTFRPTELAARCSCARETAQRTVSAFVERGWAEKVSTTAGYRLTPAGELIAEGYDRFEARIETSERLCTLLDNLSGIDIVSELGCETLEGLTHARATSKNPHAPLDRFLAVVGDEPVEEFRGVTPIVSRVFNEAANAVIEPESRVDLVVDEDVLAASRETYPEALEQAAALGGFTLVVSPEPIDYGLMIVDDHAYVGAYDETDNLVASADGTDDEFVAWAEETFEQISDDAAEWERQSGQ